MEWALIQDRVAAAVVSAGDGTIPRCYWRGRAEAHGWASAVDAELSVSRVVHIGPPELRGEPDDQQIYQGKRLELQLKIDSNNQNLADSSIAIATRVATFLEGALNEGAQLKEAGLAVSEVRGARPMDYVDDQGALRSVAVIEVFFNASSCYSIPESEYAQDVDAEGTVLYPGGSSTIEVNT